jgi:hypothetical protein
MATDLPLFPSVHRIRTDPSKAAWSVGGPGALWGVDGNVASTFVFNSESEALDGYAWRTAPNGGVAPDWTNKTITKIALYFYISSTTTMPQFQMFAVSDPAIGDYRQIGFGQFLCPGGPAYTWTLMAQATLTGSMTTWQDALAAWLKANNNAMVAILTYDSISAPHNIGIDTWQLVVTYDDTTIASADPVMEV